MFLADGAHRNPHEAMACQFPEQSVYTLVGDFALRPGDEIAVLAGRAFCILGETLARIVYACQIYPDRDLYLYLVGSSDRPYVVDGLYVPEQEVSRCHCRVAGHAVLRAGRAVRAFGKQIVGAVHSHGHGDGYSSDVDRAQMLQLACESAGWERTIEETVQEGIGSEGVARNASLYHQLTGHFRNPTESLKIKTCNAHLPPDNIQNTDRHTARHVVSTFITANSEGQLCVPVIKKHTCWACGWSRREFVEARDVNVFVLGPTGIKDEDRRGLEEELATRVQLSA